jgi:hypothetical protein
MRAQALATIARSLAVYVAIVAGAAAIGAVVGVLVLGEWFIGGGLGGVARRLVGFAHRDEHPSESRHRP